MSENKKQPPFLMCIILAAPIIIIAIIVMISHTSLYITAGWSFSSEYFILMGILGGVGITIPSIIVVLNLLSKILLEKFKDISIIDGILTFILSGVLAIAGIAFGIYSIIRGIPNPDEFGFFIAEAILLFIGSGLSVFNIFKGIQIYSWK
ncbi:MAG: hypothetical protein ACTSPY_12745 [Candidatus Helarchaeota archaeon]